MPVRPVAVLDANVLIPPGLRDLLLSCADAGVFRPVWQEEIEDELRRNSIRVACKRGSTQELAEHDADRVRTLMNQAFPDARLTSTLWLPLVPKMTNHPKDRHVLAAALGSGATHVVTTNLKDFPLASRPAGVLVQRPDSFLCARLADNQSEVLSVVAAQAGRNRRQPNTPTGLARLIADGSQTPRFGAQLLTLLAARRT